MANRYRWGVKARTVDDSATVDLVQLRQDGQLDMWECSWRNGSGALQLRYRMTVDGEERDLSEVVRVARTWHGNGGYRWWFLCPTCGRRCAKLHVPRGATRYACRLCHRLTYKSCQRSHTALAGLRRLLSSAERI